MFETFLLKKTTTTDQTTLLETKIEVDESSLPEVLLQQQMYVQNISNNLKIKFFLLFTHNSASEEEKSLDKPKSVDETSTVELMETDEHLNSKRKIDQVTCFFISFETNAKI